MSIKSKKRLIYVAPEATFGTETVTLTDYLPIQAENISFITSGPEVLPTEYFTGTLMSTASDRGGEYCEVSFDMPARGFANGQAAAVISAGDVDATDHILSAAFGTAVAQTGVGIGSGSSTSSLVTDADITTNQYLGPCYGASTNSGRVQWRRFSGIATPYAVSSNFADAPDAADSVFGTRSHSGPFSQGLSLSMYYELDSVPYVLLGGRPTSISLSCEAGKRAMWSVSMRFDNKTQASRVLTGVSTFSPAPIKCLLSGVTWGSTSLPTSSIEIDWQLSSTDIASTASTNGRSDIECIQADPVVTISPQFSLASQADFEAGTARTLLVELGGSNTASVMNTMAFFAEGGEIIEAGDTDDNGIIRQSLKIACRYSGNFAATTTHANQWKLSRA
jgi:hypothetical protein